MNIRKVKGILNLVKLAKDTVILEGKHGIGKSSIVQEYSRENNYFLTELFLSNQEVGDLIGHPITENGVMSWSIPVWLHRMQEASSKGIECVLHLDELNRADPDVLQSALQLVLEGKIHEHSLPITNNNKTQIIASINPPDDVYDVIELDPALLDRFLFISVEPDLESFLGYCEENNIHPEIQEFLKENPKYLHWSSDKIGSTPRSWAKLSNYLFLDLEENTLDIIIGKIGIIPGREFFTFMNSKINLRDVIDVIRKNKSEYSDIQELANTLPNLGSPIRKTAAIQQIKDPFDLLVFMYSLEQEILVSSLKDLKGTEMFNNLVKLDEALNNKALFKKAIGNRTHNT